MCKLDKSFNTGIKSYSFRHMRMPCKSKPGRRRGSAPYRRSDWTSRLWGCPKNGLFKTTRERRAPLSSLLQLSGTPELVTARSNARKADLEAGPLDSHNETNHRSPRPCQSRNTTNSTTSEEGRAFPVTSRNVSQQSFQSNAPS